MDPFSEARWLIAVCAARAPAGLERGGDRSAARPGAGPRAVSGASRLEPVEKVVTQSAAWGLKSYAQAGSSALWRWASGRKRTGRIVHVMRVLA